MTAAYTQPIMPKEITVSLDAGPPPGRAFRSGIWPVIYDGQEYWINAEVSTALPYNDQMWMVAEAAARQIRVSKEIIREVGPPRPVITSPLTASGAVNAPFTYQILASNSPTSFDATGLPTGLTVDTTTGMITGTPTAIGVTGVSISATNAVGTTTRTLNITIAAGLSAPVINSPTTQIGQVGVAFTYNITATNSPTSFDATNLPAGLTVNTATGLISGTPSAMVTGQVVALEATNTAGTGHQNLTLTIHPPVPVVTNPGAQNWQVGVAITNIPVSATNSPTSYAATNLPSGVTINATTGVISGTPGTGTQGARTVGLTATNAGGTSTPAVNMSVTILPAAPVITSLLAVNGTQGAAFSYTIVAAGATAFTATPLPTGLSINGTTGVISGTIGAAETLGPHNITIGASNTGGSDSQTLILTVAAPVVTAPVINSLLTASATVDAPFTYTITASNSPTSFGATGLPAWLSITGAVISGTPPTGSDASSPYNISISATNAGGSDTKTLVLTVVELTTSDVLAIGLNTARPTVGAENGSLWITNNTDGAWVWLALGIDDWDSSSGSVTP